ncbi:hypothetical protein BN1708_020208, partial [Verticillium longisporum]
TALAKTGRSPTSPAPSRHPAPAATTARVSPSPVSSTPSTASHLRKAASSS